MAWLVVRGARSALLAAMLASAACDLGLPDVRGSSGGSAGAGGSVGGGGNADAAWGGGFAGAGTGGGGTGGAAGTGGASCADVIDVGPKILTSAYPWSTPQITRLGSTFGVSFEDGDAVRFLVVGFDGSVLKESVLPGDLGSGTLSTIAQNGSAFATVTTGGSDAGNQVLVHAMDGTGAAVWKAPIPTLTQPWHRHLAGGVGQFLLTVHDGSLRAATVSASGSASALGELGKVYGGSARNWSAVAVTGGYLVLRLDQVTLRLASVSSAGVITQLPTTFADNFAPLYAFEWAGNAVFGNCQWMYELSPAGAVLSKTPFVLNGTGDDCSAAGLRIAHSEGVTVRLSTVVLGAGLKPGPLTIAGASGDPSGSPAIARDGNDGLGVVWRSQQGLSYAHVKLCPG